MLFDISIEVKCECGERLTATYTDYDKKLVVESCDRCIEEAVEKEKYLQCIMTKKK